ncbi:MAG: maleylpyruvate isomerase N-terminal domain-containing protein [Chloroflexota bacterium]
MADAITKAELLDKLREGEKSLVDQLSKLPATAFDGGVYENGWNGRQILAHIAAIEWTYPKLIDVAKSPPAPKPAATEKPKTDLPTRAAGGGIDSYNDRSISRYADKSAQELLEIFRENRKTTIATIEAEDDAVFAMPVKSAGGITGPLANVINMVAIMHVSGHVNDIVKGSQAG